MILFGEMLGFVLFFLPLLIPCLVFPKHNQALSGLIPELLKNLEIIALIW